MKGERLFFLQIVMRKETTRKNVMLLFMLSGVSHLTIGFYGVFLCRGKAIGEQHEKGKKQKNGAK